MNTNIGFLFSYIYMSTYHCWPCGTGLQMTRWLFHQNSVRVCRCMYIRCIMISQPSKETHEREIGPCFSTQEDTNLPKVVSVSCTWLNNTQSDLLTSCLLVPWKWIIVCSLHENDNQQETFEDANEVIRSRKTKKER